MDLLVFLLSFLAYIFIGSLAMCGWYKATRPHMIFSFWSAFWEKKIDDEGTTAEAEEELKDCIELKEAAFKSGNLELGESLMKDEKIKRQILENYKRVFTYTKPSWIVHPLSGCVYCYSSIYGSLIFWIGGYAFSFLSGYTRNFNNQPIIPLLICWILYCLSTCALNGILIKKVL